MWLMEELFKQNYNFIIIQLETDKKVTPIIIKDYQIKISINNNTKHQNDKYRKFPINCW